MNDACTFVKGWRKHPLNVVPAVQFKLVVDSLRIFASTMELKHLC